MPIPREPQPAPPGRHHVHRRLTTFRSLAYRSLAYRGYRIWFCGALVSNVGTWMQRTAQDWIVLTELTNHDAAAVGITTSLQLGPQLVLAPLAGAIADRFQKRTILMLTQTAMALLGFALGSLLLAGLVNLPIMYLFALLLGIASAIDAPSRQTFITDLVDREDIGNAVALNSTSFNVSRMVGPAVAGSLMLVVGSGWMFLVNGLTFGAVLVALCFISPQRSGGARSSRRSGYQESTFAYLSRRPDLVVVMTMVLIIGTIGLNFPIFLSTMTTSAFGGDSGDYGVAMSVMGIGSVAGALMTASIARPRLRSITIGAIGFAAASVVCSMASSFLVFILMLVFFGFFAQCFMTSANGYVQMSTSSRFRGRIMALYLAVFLGGTPIGAPLVGWIANVAGPRTALLLAAASAAAAGLIAISWLFLSRGGRLHLHRGDGVLHVFDLTYSVGPDTSTQPIAHP